VRSAKQLEDGFVSGHDRRDGIKASSQEASGFRCRVDRYLILVYSPAPTFRRESRLMFVKAGEDGFDRLVTSTPCTAHTFELVS
jgi:hypothetical protein